MIAGSRSRQLTKLVRLILSLFFVVPLVMASPRQAFAQPDFAFPWDSPNTWYFTGGPHDWNAGTKSGLDFAPGPSRAVLSMAQGTVKYVGWNDWGYGNNLNVRVDYGGGWEIWYLHLASTAVSVNDCVSRGQYIGEAGSTGATALHLHIELVYNNSHVSWEGHTISGWTVHGTTNYNGYLERSGTQKWADVSHSQNNALQSDNARSSGCGGSDTTRPDGDFSSPSENATITSRSVRIEGWAQDNSGGSGLSRAHVTAYYGGQWRQISSDFTSSSFGFDWDLCSAGVPDGQVTLGLDIWDNAGNQANSPHGNRHFSKSFNCSGPPPAEHPIQLYKNANYDDGYCYGDSVGWYNLDGCSGYDNQISSAVLRQGWSVRVYKERDLGGTSKCLTGSDSDFANDTFDDGTGLNDAVSSFDLFNQSSCPAPSDTTNPTGGISSPSDYATVTSGVLQLSGWAQDNSGGSGFDHAHFTINYGGWHQVSPDFTSSPFSYDWDMCVDGIPDGVTITVGLDVWDRAGNVAYSPGGVRHFTKSFDCTPNQPPRFPSNPSPANNASGVMVTSALSWSGGDPDGDATVTYNVYLNAGSSSPSTLICSHTSATSCDPTGDLSYDTDYYWKVVATDSEGLSTPGDVWRFRTGSRPNQSPSVPSSPSPSHQATGVAVRPTLTWTSSDPDAGDTVVYDVYLESAHVLPTVLVCSQVAEARCTLSTSLASDTTYYWRVIATDNHAAASTSSVWQFRTLAVDTVPPTASWVSPTEGQVVSSPSVTLEAGVSDSASGVNRVAFSAKWAGAWHGVREVTASPYRYSWDLCAAGVPDGDVELGLEAWDNAGNHYVYSEHATNRHISKRYACSPPSQGVTMDDAWTSDGGADVSVRKTQYVLGDPIAFVGQVNNQTGASASIELDYRVTAPDGRQVEAVAGTYGTSKGQMPWYLPSAVSADWTPGVYTFTATVRYGGASSTRTAGFRVYSDPSQIEHTVFLPVIRRP